MACSAESSSSRSSQMARSMAALTWAFFLWMRAARSASARVFALR